MKLLVKHKRPIHTFIPGKWISMPESYFFYIIEEDIETGSIKQLQVYPLPDAENYIIEITIRNNNCIGCYDKKTDSIIYTIESEEHNLIVYKVPEEIMTNYIQVLRSKDVALR